MSQTATMEQAVEKKKEVAKKRADQRKARKLASLPAPTGKPDPVHPKEKKKIVLKKAGTKKIGKAKKTPLRVKGISSGKSRVQFTFDLLAHNSETNLTDEKLLAKVQGEFPGVKVIDKWIPLARTWFNGEVRKGKITGSESKKHE